LRAIVSPSARERVGAALRWLAERRAGEPALVVAASADAASELLRGAASARGAAFGWHRATLARVAAELARPALAAEGLVPAGALAAQALVARVVHGLSLARRLGRLEAVAPGPGLVRALARTVSDLRHARLGAAAVEARAPELAAILAAYEQELARAGLADRAGVFERALVVAADRASAAPWLDLPTLLVDLAIASPLEAALVAALVARAPACGATFPAGDDRSLALLAAAPGVALAAERRDPAQTDALGRLQRHLFGEAPAQAARGDEVQILSAPGESRECVEIARRIVELARDHAVPFDRMAVLLRSPEEYRAHLAEACGRAGVPLYFARGTLAPEPAGRALVALLQCAADGLSARRFAEYLSLAQVPDAAAGDAAPARTFVAPDEEMVPAAIGAALEATRRAAGGAEAELADPESAQDAWIAALPPDPDAQPVVAGTLRAPWRWERLLVEAAVIGGRDRWQRRLDGLERELELDLADLADPDAPEAARLGRAIADLRALRAWALPLLDVLAALPARATWDVWRERVADLAERALRDPERVLVVLAELAPLGAAGPVDLAEVIDVLSARLREVALPPPKSRYGRVFVGPAEAARGLVFDVVFVPGLAERLFPRRIAEDPILLDAERARVGGGALETNDQRIERERLTLRLAVGAAARRVVLSYPRIDFEQARPRVPSFYALEALRAAEGELPGFDRLAARAERAAEARVGWPAPAEPAQAIDEAEHDLALLASLLRVDPERSVGTARYLLEANPHLGRALRARGRRWEIQAWTQADGLVKPSEAARAALRAHALGARSYSPTALQNFSACPYKFLLHAVHRLAPREAPEAIEELDPLQRGALFHEVQFELYLELRERGLLPLSPDNLEAARARLDRVLDEVAARHRELLAPAIERVWDDGISSVRADLREWLARSARDASGFVPWRFELAFGLPGRRGRDPASRREAVGLDVGLRLRGSIDLVERTADGRVRVTDHKTGKARVEADALVRGGESLQPVLYALAAEKLFPEARVVAGRLWYCTAAGEFATREVALDEAAREQAARVAKAIGGELERAFLPAAPAEGACRWCDYRVVCGPYEEQRTRRKRREDLAALETLRGLA
jgi:RecB family exonuclease